MEKILPKKSFLEWMKRLAAYDIFAPALQDEIWNYELVRSPAAIDMNFLLPVVPPKKIIFPQVETLFEFRTSESGMPEIRDILPESKPAVIFGVRPCDARAFIFLDAVFDGDFKDVYYFQRRNQTVLVGLMCVTPPSSGCFCLSVGGAPHSRDGLDILMTDMGETYFIEAATEKGNKLFESAKHLFKEPKTLDIQELKNIKSESEKKIARQIKNIENVSEKLKKMFDSPFWDEESRSCLKCGICTYLCPTCHCFDMNDEVESPFPLKGKRVRTWDTCQFPDFTMHTSGHNPRPDKAARLRQRIMHKFQYFVENYQRYLCTGCGRCITKCPVGIDIVDILNKVETHG
jgi:ferredoxin